MKTSSSIRRLALILPLLWQVPAVANTSSFDAALRTHLAAIENRDWVAFESTLTEADTLTFILPNGRLSKSSAEFKKSTQAWLADRDWSWSYQILSTTSNASAGVAVLDVKYADLDEAGVEYKMHYLLSLVFNKERGGWRLMHDQNKLLAK
ncbi:MAG: nuclear transport factor 2 family protein [Burkholderiales bacterium]|nr:nuclear transport factor 2 family protein [Burkholderiales bacterium]